MGWALDIDNVLAETTLAVITAMAKFGFGGGAKQAQTLRRWYEFPGLVPGWQSPAAQSALATIYNDEQVLRHLPPVPGVSSALGGQAPLMSVSLYISSREPNQLGVTQSWLKDRGLPAAPVVLRPPDEHRVNWKLDYLRQLRPAVAGLIDDNLEAYHGVPDFTGYRVWLNPYPQPGTVKPDKVIWFENWPKLADWARGV